MASVAMLERLSQAKDPKDGLLSALGDLSEIDLIGNRLLVAIYIAPEKTKGGLFRATQSIKEDVFQGSVGLVVKKGALCFQDDEASKTYFHGENVEIGEWVVFRPGDGKRVQINGVDCRFIEDIQIDMRIADPEIITHNG
jgi:co-chaperonin GroES (HSP10)